MDLNARVNVNFARIDVNFKNGHFDLVLISFFFILISVSTKVPLILPTKFQPNIPSHFGEMDLNDRVEVNVL